MTPTPQPYPAYKPSHVEWLGDVPAHWEYGGLDSIASCDQRCGASRSVSEYWEGHILWVSPRRPRQRLHNRYIDRICTSS